MSDPRVMPGCDTIRADAGSLIHQVVKLDVVVAENTGARCFALQITSNERTNNRILEIVLEVQNIERNLQVHGHTPGIPQIVQGAASAVIFPQLHGKADDLLALLL